MKKAKFRNHGPIDLVGQSSHFRAFVRKVINTNSEDVVGNYSISVEQYSKHDGKILNDASIFGDEKDKPFETLSELASFVKRDAIDHWGEEVDRLRVRRLTGGLSHHEEVELWQAHQKYWAFRRMYDSIMAFLKKNGEPIHRRNWNN